MVYDGSQQAYAQGVGTTSTNYIHIDSRDPNSTDVLYPIGKFWANTMDKTLWYLNSQTTINGYLQSNWISIASSIISLSDTSDTPVYPSVGTDVPPNNIQLINLDGSVTIVSDPADHRIVISSTSALTPEVTVYIVGPHGNYSTIQSAINQAVTDGASASRQAEIWIADGQYTEDLLLNDYVNLVGLSNGPSNAVQIIGSATYGGSGSFAATNVAFIEPADSQALLLNSSSSATISLNSVLINGSDGGGYGLNIIGSGVNATLTNCVILAGTGTNVLAIQNGVLNLISCQTHGAGGGSFVFGGTLNINDSNIYDWFQLNNASSTINLNNFSIDSTASSFPCIQCGTGNPTINAYNGTFISNSVSGAITGVAGFSYGSIIILGQTPAVSNTLSLSGATEFNGNLSFDGGQTTLSTDGQLWIGNSSTGNPTVNTLTAGSGINIVNGNGSITISANNSGENWSVVTTNQTLADSNGYFANGVSQLIFTLPSTSDVGDTYEVVAMNSNGFQIAQNSGQSIQIDSLTTTTGTGGSISSTGIGNVITLVCNVADTSWFATSYIGLLTVV